MKQLILMGLLLLPLSCAVDTDEEEGKDTGTEETAEDATSEEAEEGDGSAAGTCLAGEDCGSDTPEDFCLPGEEGCDEGSELPPSDPAGGTCLAGTDCGSDTPDSFCLEGEEGCGMVGPPSEN